LMKIDRQQCPTVAPPTRSPAASQAAPAPASVYTDSRNLSCPSLPAPCRWLCWRRWPAHLAAVALNLRRSRLLPYHEAEEEEREKRKGRVTLTQWDPLAWGRVLAHVAERRGSFFSLLCSLGLRFLTSGCHGTLNLSHRIPAATCCEMGLVSGGRPGSRSGDRTSRQWSISLWPNLPNLNQEFSWYGTRSVVLKKKWPPPGWFCCAIRWGLPGHSPFASPPPPVSTT
jgi:hypothetical protein